MDLVPSSATRPLMAAITEVFIPHDTAPNSTIELVITIDDEQLNVRDFGYYLALADSVYGRFSAVGLQRYSHTREGRLQIKEVRKGSLETVIEESIKNAPGLLMLYIVLKYLPSVTGAIKDMAESYRAWEDARLTRARREKLKAEMNQDQDLQKLEPKRRNQVIRVLVETGQLEHKRLPSASRFAIKSVRSVSIRVKKQNQ